MTRDTSPLGQAWRSHVSGRAEVALSEFQKIAATSPEDLDILYGLGLAQKGAGLKTEAEATFLKLAGLLAAEPEDEDDRNRIEMLRRMVKQQLEFLRGVHG